MGFIPTICLAYLIDECSQFIVNCVQIFHVLLVGGCNVQFLLGIFYYVEAVVLLEDFVDSLEESNVTTLDMTTAYERDVITNGYRKAA